MNQNREYPTIEIDWQPALDNNDNPINAKDGTPIVVSEPMVLTPKVQGQYGGWAFSDVDGFWSLPPSAPSTAITLGLAALVTLSLGGHKSTGGRYQNIWDIKPVEGSQVSVQTPQTEPDTLQADNLTDFVDRDAQRNNSIREQAFYNNLNPDILAQLPAAQQAALLKAYFDTAMLMMRDEVRKRAQDVLITEATKEITEPNPEQEQEETVETLAWD